VLCLAALPVLTPSATVSHTSLAQQVHEQLARIDSASDAHTAHALAMSALDLASRAAVTSPADYAPLVDQIRHKLDAVDCVYPVTPAMAVKLGPGGANVVDLSVAPDALYTLDAAEASVRAFAVDTTDQSPTPSTLLLRAGSLLGTRRLGTPVAIGYVGGTGDTAGDLVVIDDARTVFQLGPDGNAMTSVLPSSASWQELAGLATDAQGALYVLDRGASSLLQYTGATHRLADPPRLLFDGLPLLDPRPAERPAEVLPLQDIYLRLDDGQVQRLDRAGSPLEFQVDPPDGPLGAVAGLAADGSGGLFLADPAHARIVQTTADGTFIRQLRDPALAGIRQLHASPDGRRLYALISSGVLVIDVPPM
jgi:hypothetical protein